MDRDSDDLKQDKDALQDSESRYRNIFEASLDGLLLVDATTGEVLDANPKFMELFGYTQDKLLQKKVWELAFLNYIIKNHICFNLLRTKDVVYFNELTLISEDGQSVVVELFGSTFQKGASEEMLFNVRDISQRKQIEAVRIKNQKLDSIGVLAGGIAHDYNNILTAIMGNLSMLRLEEDPEKQKLVDVALRAAKRATGLTKKLLTFARGNILDMKAYSAVELVKEAVDLIEGETSQHTCKLLLPDHPCWVKVDSGQINQVLLNLILNALQAMPSGGSIEIKVANEELSGDNFLGLSPGDYVHISVSDEGGGISTDNLEKIFDPYFTTKNSWKNQGLGLSVIQTVVKNHHGAINVETRQGVGTIFNIYLPSQSEEEINKSMLAQTISTPKTLKVLYMDDEQTVRDLMRHIFNTLDHELELVEHGEQAIAVYMAALIAEKPFDLVIFDIVIPGKMSAVETLKRLKEVNPNIVAIATSGYVDIQPTGFGDFLPKPFTYDDLKNLLEKYTKS